MGILGQISHLSEYYAKQMFEPYRTEAGTGGDLGGIEPGWGNVAA